MSIVHGLTWREHVDSLGKNYYCAHGLAKLWRLRTELPPETNRFDHHHFTTVCLQESYNYVCPAGPLGMTSHIG